MTRADWLAAVPKCDHTRWEGGGVSRNGYEVRCGNPMVWDHTEGAWFCTMDATLLYGDVAARRAGFAVAVPA